MYQACTLLFFLICFITGCGGGGTTTPSTLSIVRVRFSRELAVNTPGYSGDELTIEVEISGGSPSEVVWNFGGGATFIGIDNPIAPVVELGIPGEYSGQVTITDAAGGSDQLDFPFIVLPEEHRIRGFSPAHPAGVEDEQVQFRLDVDGEVEVATWTFRNGSTQPVVTGVAPLVQLTTAGLKEVTIRVTLKSGPTVSRTFPFEVIENPWHAEFDGTKSTASNSLVLSDGGLVVIRDAHGTESRPLTWFSAPAGGHEQPDQWTQHEFGVQASGFRLVKPVESAGSVAVVYRANVLAESTDPGVYLAVSASLHPAQSADWHNQSIGSFPGSFGPAAMTSRTGGGWHVALRSLPGTDSWASTSQMSPEPGDWISGPFPLSASAEVTLTTMSDALVCVVVEQDTVTLRAAEPATFDALLASTPYLLPARIGQFEARDNVLAGILSGSDEKHTLAIAQGPPFALTDWLLIETTLTPNIFPRFDIGIDDESIFVLGKPEFTMNEQVISKLELSEWALTAPEASPVFQTVSLDGSLSNYKLIETEGDPVIVVHQGSTNFGLILKE